MSLSGFKGSRSRIGLPQADVESGDKTGQWFSLDGECSFSVRLDSDRAIMSGVPDLDVSAAARPRIMIDGAQFLSAQATGMGSYARTLANTLSSSGCSVSILYGRPMIGDRSNLPMALSSQVFGKTPLPNPFEKLTAAASKWLGARSPFRSSVKPIEICPVGVDFASTEPPVPLGDRIYNVDKLYDLAAYRFITRQGLTAVKAKGCPNVYTIHDLIPMQYPHFVLDRGGRAAKIHSAIAREADMLITVSEASKQAIVELLHVPPERVHVTYQPTPPLPTLAQEECERFVQTVYGVKPGGYAIFLGAIEPKKNLKRLIEAFVMAAPPGFPLLIAGPLGWMYEADVQLIELITRNITKHQFESPVQQLGFLPRLHVSALLKCARFMAFPSICEGFGLPVLEAMQMGVPVLTSNTSSLPEVAGDAAVLVDPLSVTAISEGIRQLANDSDLRSTLITRGHLQAAKFGREIYIGRLREAYAKVGVHLPCRIPEGAA
jgi:glycosyltransferase involved in cell wall biosynthesis